MTLHELSEAFLAANKNRLSPNTLRAYGYDLGLLLRELPNIPAKEIIARASLRLVQPGLEHASTY